MKRTSHIQELCEIIASEKGRGRKIAFVPTMGYLHKGHLSLIEHARKTDAFLVVSIFVNPLQFGPNEDLGRYPRDIERDARLVEEAGVDVLFHPSVEEMYPRPMVTFVEVRELDAMLCGAARPGHFRGVATVVNKLFNIVQPDMAFFGQKDYQQYLIIKRMVADLSLPIEIFSVPIVREDDGLAMSSRNVYLTPEQRQEALVLFKSLNLAQKNIQAGERSARNLERQVREKINTESHGVIDYVEVRDACDLSEVTEITGPVILALAVKFGKTRLIDNKVVEGDHYV
ncbi:pantoate--beta-alanine ligase [Desulfosporosinus orientis DSM 765]|uniref:Pantothenate synthetase n=1 Tax=Desulfosporosinus orientis (strain ATCC 19365 / DSM 765 / NCIMB 8382 / VKM B-1628 / Singapore I) TaxID=768706 RepID=G7W4X1_DESOD|nr:pantoate--beta-alanine ligase [Desulfosporosinus orientis]AET65843.1 pantoate--beta-alanine ligase [Desulfosporosinus orientis DSM 765]